MAREPKNYPCDHCDCDRDGRASDGGRWIIKTIVEPGPDGTPQMFRTEICPRRLVTADTLRLFDLYAHYRNGVLLDAGGLYDQPAIYCRAMSLIGAIMTSKHDE